MSVQQENCLAVHCSLLMGCNILCNNVFSFPWYAICFEWASGGPVLNYIGWSECTNTGLTGKLPGCSLQFVEWVWLLFAIEWFWFNFFWEFLSSSLHFVHGVAAVFDFKQSFHTTCAQEYTVDCFIIIRFFNLILFSFHKKFSRNQRNRGKPH